MNKKTALEIKKLIQHVEEQGKPAFYLIWREEDFAISLQKKLKDNADEPAFTISSSTGDYIVENIRSLDNSYKIQDLQKELEEEA